MPFDYYLYYCFDILGRVGLLLTLLEVYGLFYTFFVVFKISTLLDTYVSCDLYYGLVNKDVIRSKPGSHLISVGLFFKYGIWGGECIYIIGTTWDDRAERHDLKSQFLLFILLFFFPLFIEGSENGKRITKVVILSHTFRFDPWDSNVVHKTWNISMYLSIGTARDSSLVYGTWNVYKQPDKPGIWRPGWKVL